MDFFSILKLTDLFKNLKKNEIFELLENSQVHQHKAGDKILEKGKDDPFVKILVHGRVYLTRQDGTEIELSQGAYFGELNLLNDSKVVSDIYAKTDVDVLLLSYKDIQKCYNKNLRIYGVMMENLARVLAKRLVDKGSSNKNKKSAA